MYGSFQSDTGMNSQGGGQDQDSILARLRNAVLMSSVREQSQPLPPESDTLNIAAAYDPSMSGPDAAAMPKAKDPDTTLAHAQLSDQPATQYVNQAQAGLDKFNNTPLWKRMIGPALITAGSIGGTNSYNGAQVQKDAGDAIAGVQDRRTKQRDYLTNQVNTARTMQQQEYESDQRNRQQDVIQAGNNQNRRVLADIAAGAKRDVAGTNADARTYGADQQRGGRVEAAHITADAGLEGRKYAADKGFEAAKLRAQEAMSRFLAGQDREDARQGRTFAHGDLKPTADEDRRADLASAAIEYSDMLKDIATRRPELFGPLAGRVTQGRQWLGSEDPDVAKLKWLREQIGIVNMGAHSLRSAQAIAPIADSLVNSFNTPAEALIPNIDMMQKGLKIFMGPQQRPTAYYPGGQSTDITPNGRTTSTSSSTSRSLTSKVTGSGKVVNSKDAAQPNDVYKGYQYLGGDKNQQSSWKKVVQ